MKPAIVEVPALRLEMSEAAEALRCSRAWLYKKIKAGEIKSQTDGKRRYISITELQRYVASRDAA